MLGTHCSVRPKKKYPVNFLTVIKRSERENEKKLSRTGQRKTN